MAPVTTFDGPIAAGVRRDRPRTAVVHRNLDAWLIGGFSLLVFAVMYVSVDKGTAASQVTWAAFYLAFVVNGPHFFASYWHIYVDGRAKIFHDRRYFWAGVVVPILLVVGLLIGSQRPTDATLGRMVSLMYLSVGWHYVKQIFGVALVSSAAHGRPVIGWAKLALRINLLAIWLMSFVTTNDYKGGNVFYGVKYHSAGLPDWTRPTAYVIVAATAVVALGLQAAEWVRSGTSMALVGWVAWATIYVWYLPVLVHQGFFYFVPFFHSLQYLMFSVTLSWNKSRDGKSVLADQPARLRFIRRFGAFVVVSFVLGAAGFHWLPEWLDRNHAVRPDVLGAAYWVVAFNLFINIHHYFVDNVIWRRTNDDIRTFLRPR